VLFHVSVFMFLGLHNGHTAVADDWHTAALFENKEDANTLICKESHIIELENYVPHDLMAVAVVVEYEVAVALSADTHLNTNTVLQAQVQHNKLVVTLCIGACVYLPSEGKRVYLQSQSFFDKFDAPHSDEARLNLDLRVDEVCSVLTGRPTFKDLGDDGDLIGHKQRLQTAVKSTRFADSKDSGAGANKTDQDSDSDAITGIIVECVCSVVDRSGHDILQHGDSVASLLNEPAGASALDEDVDPDRPKRRSAMDEDDSAFADEKPSRLASIRNRIAAGRESRDTPIDRRSEGTTKAPRPRYDAVARDDDVDSVTGSVVNGTSETSSINLDLRYYSSGQGGHLSARSAGLASDRGLGGFGGMDSDPRFVAARGQSSSLMAQALQTTLRTTTASRSGKLAAMDGDGFDLLESRAPKGSLIGALPPSRGHVRDLSRAARSRLHRHGIETAIADDVVYHKGGPFSLSKQLPRSAQAVKDVDLEAADMLALHDVSLQFVGYKVVAAKRPNGADEGDAAYQPRSIYCTFKFFTCSTTKTEVMRLLPAGKGQTHVLVRDSHAQQRVSSQDSEAPNSIRFAIDTSVVSPTEAHEFASYLYSHQLFIDVWDSESQLLLGTCAVPLKKLMRQQQPTVKCTLETDIINADIAQYAGSRSQVIARDAPLAGLCLGSLQLVLCNYGNRGQGTKHLARPEAKESGADLLEGLNWRAYGSKSAPSAVPDPKFGTRGTKRPKHSVRARPLTDSSPELNQILKDYRDSGGTSNFNNLSTRSLFSSSRG
jgi:hypothetical protein